MVNVEFSIVEAIINNKTAYMRNENGEVKQYSEKSSVELICVIDGKRYRVQGSLTEMGNE